MLYVPLLAAALMGARTHLAVGVVVVAVLILRALIIEFLGGGDRR